jgi:hypothetical protein
MEVIEWIEWTGWGFFSLMILLAASMLFTSIRRMRRSEDKRGDRFLNGWLGALALMFGPLACTGMSLSLTEHVYSSGLALAVVILMNLLAQPVWLMFCVIGFRKITLALSGRIGYAWRAIPEEELVDVTPADRRMVLRYCIAQGAVVGPFGAAMSIACACPLLP